VVIQLPRGWLMSVSVAENHTGVPDSVSSIAWDWRGPKAKTVHVPVEAPVVVLLSR